MISIFPEFINLSIDIKEEIEKVIDQFPPYSDFNFVSLWCWNLSNKTELSLLNDNLVIRMEDYTTSEIFYMFIGNSKVAETVSTLFEYLKSIKAIEEIYLIPEEMVQKNNAALKKICSIEEDRDNFDYLIDVDKLSKMEGRNLHQKRKLLNHFLEKNKPKVVTLRLNEDGVIKQVLDFFDVWKKAKGEYDSKNEEIAINNLFDLKDFTNLYVLFAFIDKKMIGFSVFEILLGYGIGDFQKGDINYKGIYEFLNFSIAKFLKEKQCKYYNIEQDLGIEGLRRAKLDYDPTFLKKYTLKGV